MRELGSSTIWSSWRLPRSWLAPALSLQHPDLSIQPQPAAGLRTQAEVPALGHSQVPAADSGCSEGFPWTRPQSHRAGQAQLSGAQGTGQSATCPPAAAPVFLVPVWFSSWGLSR